MLSSRVDRTEKLIGAMREGLKKINEKESSLRNCYDQLVEQISEYTSNERYNPTSREGLQNYANYLSAIQDYRDTFIQRIQQQILQPLSQYPDLIKNTRVRATESEKKIFSFSGSVAEVAFEREERIGRETKVGWTTVQSAIRPEDHSTYPFAASRSTSSLRRDETPRPSGLFFFFSSLFSSSLSSGW